MKQIEYKGEFKCNQCGCDNFSVIEFNPLIVVCKYCGRQIDSDKFIVKEVEEYKGGWHYTRIDAPTPPRAVFFFCF